MADPHVFEFRGTFELPLTPRQTWAQLERTERYESWWPWMRHLEVEGNPLDPGTAFTFLIVAPIPFTMRLRAEVTSAEPPDRVEARVSGDLTGTADMTFSPNGPGRSLAEVHWEVEVTRPTIRSVARVTRPLLLWGQGWAVDIAFREFRRHLDVA